MEKELEILALSEYGECILKNIEGGNVHSIYRNTVNLSVGNTLLALQSQDSTFGANSLITNLIGEEMGELFLPNEEFQMIMNTKENIKSIVEISLESITKSWRILFKNARIYQMKLEVIPLPDKKLELYQKIERALAEEGLKEEGIFYTHLKRLQEKAKVLFIKQEYKESVNTLIQCIGLGIGLTPSGDDFLYGVLAACILMGQEDNIFTKYLKKEIRYHIYHTNDISHSFFLSALEGYFSNAIKNITEYSTATRIREAFLDIGHSSGMDSLRGIYYGISLFLPI